MNESERDQVFSKRLSEVKAFEFNHDVTHVFKDMISRSVPGYSILLHLIGLYADIFVDNGSRVYDLGCSLGDASLIIAEQTQSIDCEIIAIDSSTAMIQQCRQQHPNPNIEWRCEEIQQSQISEASMVVLNLTLQFLQPDERLSMLQSVFAGLNSGGVLVLSEKVEFDSSLENQRMRQLHLGFKKTMGYSDLEISQKRSALENVLVPDLDQQHRLRLTELGFEEVYLCYRCFNFVSYLAIKG